MASLEEEPQAREDPPPPERGQEPGQQGAPLRWSYRSAFSFCRASYVQGRLAYGPTLKRYEITSNRAQLHESTLPLNIVE